MNLNKYYKNKSNRELYRIFKGFNNSTYDEKLVAQKLLEERNFDFENIHKYKNQWELEKLEREIVEERSNFFNLNLWYNPDFLLIFSIGMLLSSVFLIIQTVRHLLTDVNLMNIESFIMMIFSVFFPILGLIILRYSKTRRKYLKFRQNRIVELKIN